MKVDLETEIREIILRLSQKSVALKLCMTESDLSKKLKGDRGWKIKEIQGIFELGGIRLISDCNDDSRLVMELSRKLWEVMKLVSEKQNLAGGGSGS